MPAVVPPHDSAAAATTAVGAAPAGSTWGAGHIPGSYALVGILVVCVSILGFALKHQAQVAAEREVELAETRRLHQEMTALIKETREAVKPAVVPAIPLAEAGPSAVVPTGKAGAPPVAVAQAPPALASVQAAPSQAALPVVPPVVAAPAVAAQAAAARPAAAPAVAAPLVAVTAERPSNSVALANAVSPALAPAPPSVDQPASPIVPPPRTFSERIAVAEQAKTRRPAVVAKAVEPVREFAMIPSLGDVSPPPMPKLRPAEPAFREYVAIPPAVKNAALPPRPPLVGPWMKIIRGMSQREVRKLLGEPRSTEQLMTGEFWYYADQSMLGRGWVAFSETGVVIEWLVP